MTPTLAHLMMGRFLSRVLWANMVVAGRDQQESRLSLNSDRGRSGASLVDERDEWEEEDREGAKGALDIESGEIQTSAVAKANKDKDTCEGEGKWGQYKDQQKEKEDKDKDTCEGEGEQMGSWDMKDRRIEQEDRWSQQHGNVNNSNNNNNNNNNNNGSDNGNGKGSGNDSDSDKEKLKEKEKEGKGKEGQYKDQQKEKEEKEKEEEGKGKGTSLGAENLSEYRRACLDSFSLLRSTMLGVDAGRGFDVAHVTHRSTVVGALRLCSQGSLWLRR